MGFSISVQLLAKGHMGLHYFSEACLDDRWKTEYEYVKVLIVIRSGNYSYLPVIVGITW